MSGTTCTLPATAHVHTCRSSGWYNMYTSSYNACTHRLQPVLDKKCSLFPSCRGSKSPCFSYENDSNVQLVTKLFSLYTPMTVRRLSDAK